MLDQVELEDINHATADGAYDSNSVYNVISKKYKNARIIIPPNKTVKERKNNPEQRNENIRQINNLGRIPWQKLNNYGKRNKSETAIKRYKVIIGNKLHSRLLENQKAEAIIACGILNKMTSLRMPISQKIA
jgi:transposase